VANLLRAETLSPPIIVNPGEASIEEYAEVIGSIWPQDLDRPIWLSWIHVLSHATIACEEVRKNRWHRVAKELAEVVVWWLTFTRQVTRPPKKMSEPDRLVPFIGSTASDIVWYKFPRLCPVCLGRWLADHCTNETSDPAALISSKMREINAFFKENPQCTCLAAKKSVEERDEAFKSFIKQCVRAYARKVRQKSKPASMKDMAEMIKGTFANCIEVLSVEEIAFHLLEEVGEVSKSLANLYMQDTQDLSEAFLKERQDKVIDFAEELADVFSWAVSLLAKIHRFLECAAEFASEYKTVEGTPELVRGNLDRTRNIVDLIWTIYGKGSVLVCEQCREFPCNPNHPAHEGKRGLLAGKKLRSEVCELLLKGSQIT
jgi:NTP pyrophosphatase (non-canonical NTP hydrolase)